MPATAGTEHVERMQVSSLWRYPVKSMQGEACTELCFEASGVADDRGFGVLDIGSRTIVSAKRDGRLLEAAARLGAGGLVVRLPGGPELVPGAELDDCLERWLGRPVRLVEAAGHGTGTFECPEDFERDDSEVVRWRGPAGSFVDESPLHLLTTADLDQLASERPKLQWDVRRFRPNVVVETGPGGLGPPAPGQRLGLGGDVEIEVQKGCSRCVMTTRSQPGALERQLDILRHVIKAHDNEVGLRARVVRAGVVRVGDRVSVID